MLAYIVFIIAQTDVIKYMLSKPILYVPQKAVKG